ncbi:hypothetical protein E7Z54_11205 [Nocardioides sp.]|nr:hypothetical protein E7Z54_11205 [Nocardioides sp.]
MSRRAVASGVAGVLIATLGTILQLGGGAAPTASAHGETNVTGCQVKSTLGGRITWHHFTRPHAPCELGTSSAQDVHIRNEMIRLIDDTPAPAAGADPVIIRGAFLAIREPAVVDALKRAHDRGVTVRFTFTYDTPQLGDKSFYRAFGGRRCGEFKPLGGSSPLYSPDDDGDGTLSEGRWGCNSDHTSGIAHTKAMTFSKTKDPEGVVRPWVVWTGSHNAAQSHGGSGGYNNSMTSYNDQALYGDHENYDGLGVYNILRQMYNNADEPIGAPRRLKGWVDYYVPDERGTVNGLSANIIASPEAQTDFIVGRLNLWQPNGNCEVRVQQAVFRRAEIAEKLVQMSNAGCRVWVMAGTYTPSIVDILKRAAGAMSIREMPRVHDKSFLVQGNRKSGGSVSYQVYAGSHNLNVPSLRQNDEFFVMLTPEGDTHPVYNAYNAHFGPHGPWGQCTVDNSANGCQIYR